MSATSYKQIGSRLKKVLDRLSNKLDCGRSLVAQGKMTVYSTKTERPRIVEMTRTLTKKLLSVPKAKRQGKVVPFEDSGFMWQHQADHFLKEIAKLCPTEKVPPEKIKYNVWRHTFGSLLVQNGASIEFAANQLGDTIDTARRHYLQFLAGNTNAAVDAI